VIGRSPTSYQTGAFTHRGHRLVYDEYGSGPEVVVYLHALLMDSEMNRGIAAVMAATGHHVILIDLLGHGRSDKPAHASQYRIDDYAHQVFGLLDHLGVERAVLGGTSLGANVSLWAAAERQARVNGLILEMPVLEWAVPPAAILFGALLLGVHYGRRILPVVTAPLRMVPQTPFASLNSVIGAVTSPPDVVASVLHGILVGPVAPTVEERSRVTVPTLVLAHRRDLIHPFDDAVRLADLLPNASLERAWSPLELRLRPARLSERIGSFVDSVYGAEWAGAGSDSTGTGGDELPSWSEGA